MKWVGWLMVLVPGSLIAWQLSQSLEVTWKDALLFLGRGLAELGIFLGTLIYCSIAVWLILR